MLRSLVVLAVTAGDAEGFALKRRGQDSHKCNSNGNDCCPDTKEQNHRQKRDLTTDVHNAKRVSCLRRARSLANLLRLSWNLSDLDDNRPSSQLVRYHSLSHRRVLDPTTELRRRDFYCVLNLENRRLLPRVMDARFRTPRADEPFLLLHLDRAVWIQSFDLLRSSFRGHRVRRAGEAEVELGEV